MNIQSCPIIVVNLPERIDRLEQIRKELPKLFFNPDFTVSPGVIDKDVRLGIIQAMKNAVSIAKQNDYSHAIILEDDCKLSISPKLIDYAEKAFNEAPEDWDVLLGGMYNGKPKPFNHYWSSVHNFCGAHFVVYRKESYDKVLNHNFDHKHFDRGLSDCCKVYVINEFIATQHNGYSDQRKKKVDDDHFLTKFKLL